MLSAAKLSTEQLVSLLGGEEIIKEKLAELKNLDKRFSIFGSNRHKYELNRTLSDEEINNLEKDNQISISNDYKEFLKYLGNGGAGCGYGLERLELKNVNPPYIGTKKLLRNWKDPKKIDCNINYQTSCPSPYFFTIC